MTLVLDNLGVAFIAAGLLIILVCIGTKEK